MRSRTAKELQPLAGRPLLSYILESAEALRPAQRILVLSPAKRAAQAILPPGWQVAWQEQPLGTGHALAQALPLLAPSVCGVLLLFGDHPLLGVADLQRLLAVAGECAPAVALLTTVLDDPAAYGRVRRHDGKVVGVVEAREDTAAYPGAVEVVSGATWYDRRWLEDALPRLERSPSGEYYHTWLVELAACTPWPVDPAVAVAAPPESALGVNDRVDLARAEAIVRRRIAERLMRAGVAIVDPSTTYIDATVEIEPDARIEPFTIISGQSRIGEGSRIGPHAIVRDSQIGAECEVLASVVEGAILGRRVHVGPYAHLRPGTHVADDVHIGNYAELKEAQVGRATRIGHFSYLGDAEVGERVNIGAGTVTCNFDGVDKHRTVIEDDAFIGSDTLLVAPVRVGRGGRTGAGSVVNRDVPPGRLVVGIPARPIDTRRSRLRQAEGA
jgi:bifunctional UDP-N-acetylglucosamine pyrophosphorylase/glucosamine-1-phosphate N-acetyltransferase